MHSTSSGPVTFFHNGDFSGLIHFTAPVDCEPDSGAPRAVAAPFAVLAAAALRHDQQPDDTDVPLEVRTDDGTRRAPHWEPVTVTVPVSALRDLVGKRVQYERMSRLEEMSYAEVYADALTREVKTWASEDPGWA